MAILWRVAVVQLVAVAALSIILAIALPDDFFVTWGWLAGPAAWISCSALTARVVGLALPAALIGAVLAGIPSAIAVVLNLHWLGAAAAVVLFAIWCSRLPRGRAAWT